MGDVISSSAFKGPELNARFNALIRDVNETRSRDILSPFTITLGDEFQGVAASLTGALKSILYLEELILKNKDAFGLRYVVYFGEITTQINPNIAHGMLGNGLTRARQLITEKKKTSNKFTVRLDEKTKSEQVNLCLRLMEGLTGAWNVKDYHLIYDMIRNTNNEEVGRKHNKNRSQIWKRRRTLKTEEYNTAKKLLFSLI
ncbi:MAG: SatD family protein [Balneolales bacterium]